MSEETKKQETMDDYMNEINASFSNFRDDDMLIWDKLAQMQEDKTDFEVTVEGIVKGGVIAYVEGIRAFIPVSQLADRKSTRLNSSHTSKSRMPSSA